MRGPFPFLYGSGFYSQEKSYFLNHLLQINSIDINGYPWINQGHHLCCNTKSSTHYTWISFSHDPQGGGGGRNMVEEFTCFENMHYSGSSGARWWRKGGANSTQPKKWCNLHGEV